MSMMMNEVRRADFHGYTIYEDGRIIGLHGREIKKRLKDGRYEIRLNVKGERKNYMVSRLIYYVFEPFDIDDRNLCVSYKDGDKTNIHFDNLFLAHRKDLIQGDKHKNVSALTDEQAEEIRRLYTGKVSVNQHDQKAGYSYQDLADMYGVSKANIMWIVKGMSRNKDDYKLK